MAKKTKKVVDTKHVAAMRVLKAEEILDQAIDDLEKAQAQISVINQGLARHWSDIFDAREKLKGIMYDLRKRRESGRCDLDESTAQKLLVGPGAIPSGVRS